MIYFSKATGGFYLTEIHGGSIPADALEIAEDQWRDLLEQQSLGKAITADANGYPIAVEREPSPPAVIVVSATQAKVALASAGLFIPILAFIASLPVDDARRIAWETAAEFTSDSPTLIAIAQQFDLTDEQIRALFADAESRVI